MRNKINGFLAESNIWFAFISPLTELAKQFLTINFLPLNHKLNNYCDLCDGPKHITEKWKGNCVHFKLIGF